MGKGHIDGLEGKGNIRKVNIHGVTYYIYDLPSDKKGKQKRLYDRSKSRLEKHILEYEKLRSSLMQGIVEDAVTFSDLYSCFLTSSMSLQQRELYSVYEPLISSLLAVDLSEVTKPVILQFLQNIAPERSNYAIESLGKMLNNVLRFASEKGRLPSIHITKEDIDAINEAKIQREPVYCLEDYERVFLKLQQKTKRNADKKIDYKYKVATILIPFLIDAKIPVRSPLFTIRNLTQIKWKHLSKNRVYLPFFDDTYKVSDDVLQLICDYHSLRYSESYPNGFAKEDIADLPQEDCIFSPDAKQIFNATATLKHVLFRLGLPDNVSIPHFVKQIQNLQNEE